MPHRRPLPQACQTPQPPHPALGFQLRISEHRKPSEKKKSSFLLLMSHSDEAQGQRGGTWVTVLCSLMHVVAHSFKGCFTSKLSPKPRC